MSNPSPETQGFVLRRKSGGHAEYVRRWLMDEPATCSKGGPTSRIVCPPPVAVVLTITSGKYGLPGVRRRVVCAFHLTSEGTTRIGAESRKAATRRLLAAFRTEYETYLDDEIAARTAEAGQRAEAELSALLDGQAAHE